MSLPARDADPRVESPGTEAADAALVEAFLRANPAWLAEHPELYRVLEPPRAGAWRGAGRPHGGDAAGRSASAPMALLAAGRAAAGLAGRVQDAVLALLRAPRSGGLRERRDAGHPGDRRGAALRRGGASRRAPSADRHGRAAAGRRDRWCSATRPPMPPAARRGGGTGAPRCAGARAGEGPAALLALLARDRHVLDPAQGPGRWLPRPRRGRCARALRP